MINDGKASRHSLGREDVPSGRPAPVEVIIDATVAAAIAAHAACTVAGVVRLEPGLSGLVTHLAARARHQVRQADPSGPAPAEGVEVDVDGATARVHIDLVTSAGPQAATVAHQVQAAVAQSLLVNAGVTVTRVSVSILDIDQPRLMEAWLTVEGQP